MDILGCFSVFDGAVNDASRMTDVHFKIIVFTGCTQEWHCWTTRFTGYFSASFEGTCILFCIVATPTYSPTKQCMRFPFSHPMIGYL